MQRAIFLSRLKALVYIRCSYEPRAGAQIRLSPFRLHRHRFIPLPAADQIGIALVESLPSRAGLGQLSADEVDAVLRIFTSVTDLFYEKCTSSPCLVLLSGSHQSNQVEHVLRADSRGEASEVVVLHKELERVDLVFLRNGQHVLSVLHEGGVFVDFVCVDMPYHGLHLNTAALP